MHSELDSTQSNIKKIGYFAKNNMLTELNDLLIQQKTALSGHHFWNYRTDKYLVECAARDAILAGHEDVVKLLFDAGLSPNDHAFENDTTVNEGVKARINGAGL